MLPAYIPDHVVQAFQKLTTPFKGRPRFAAWCRSVLNRTQELEDMLQVFLESFDLDTCDLPRLTLIGKIVGQTPVGSLETFRRLVKVRILVNRTDTTAPTLIKIAKLLTGSEVYYSDGDCAILIESRSALPGDVDPAILVAFLRAAKMGGVRLDLIAGFEDDGLLLGDDSSAGVVDATHGLADDGETAGGFLSGAY
jgi:hypothetical protein